LDALGCADEVRQAGCVVDQVRIRRGTRQLLTDLTPGVAISRSTLDALLAQEVVTRGGVFVDGWRARVSDEGSSGDGAQVTLTPMDANAEERVVQARMVVVCDGLTGTALDASRWPVDVSPRARMGVGGLVGSDQVDCASREICMHVGSGSCAGAGYVGLVRLEDGRIDVAGALDSKFVRSVEGPAAACAAVLRSAGLECNGFEDVDFRGTGLLSRQRERVESARVIVLGDSAGYVEPFTGEGMSWAIGAGVRAGWWVDGRLGGQMQPGWKEVMGELMAGRQLWCRVVAGAVRSAVMMNATLALGGVLPGVSRAMMARVGRVWPRRVLTGGAG
jgi:flavin-dependent dehydrogenase